jgi:rSAM/selenodomain-associated transferase 2
MNTEPSPPEFAKLSLIVPTLNAAAHIGSLLASVQAGEKIVADGGSSDATTAIAAQHGARVIGTARGRGVQLRAGAAAAQGAWLLVLHADSRIGPDGIAAVAAHIADPANVMLAAHFRFALDDAAQAARRLEAMVAWRCRVLALPYGDQGLLISRPLYDAVGGYDAVPLMEDVALVRRLGRGRLVALAAPLLTSAARYRRDGYLLRSARNLALLALYSAGVPPRIISRIY